MSHLAVPLISLYQCDSGLFIGRGDTAEVIEVTDVCHPDQSHRTFESDAAALRYAPEGFEGVLRAWWGGLEEIAWFDAHGRVFVHLLQGGYCLADRCDDDALPRAETFYWRYIGVHMKEPA